MYVPSHQMHNVLNVYSKQLRQTMASEGKSQMPPKPESDKISLSPEGKRQALIDKVSKDILDKISNYSSRNENHKRFTEYANANVASESLPQKLVKKTFVFNAIDSINQKIKNTLSVDDSNFLLQQFERLAKKAGDKKMESWI